MKKIIITGGGTGGHVVPCLAVADGLKDEYIIHYIGSKNGIENQLVKKYPYIIYHSVTTCKLVRGLSPQNLLIPFRLLKGYKESKKIISQIKPDVIFSKGGYVSLPTVYAGNKLKVPIISHESDLSLGLANKLNLSKSKYMCCSFEETTKKIKNGVFTGSPVRRQIFGGNKDIVIKKSNGKKNILVLGGSMGSRTLNELVRRNIDTLCSKYNVYHICGKNNLADVNKECYFQYEFVDNIEDFYDAASCVICRGGSNVIFELLSLKKPMLIVPLEKGSRGDQVENAKYFENHGYATMIKEDVADDKFVNMIDNTLNKKFNYSNKVCDGTNNIISIIKELTD